MRFIYENIKAEAERQHKSLAQVAVRSGIGRKTIYLWRTNPPYLSSLVLVAKYLKVPVTQLLAGIDDLVKEE